MTQDTEEGTPQERLIHTLNKTGISQLLGFEVVTAHAGVGKARIQVDERLMHPHQIVHGGVIFTLADTAMGMALMSVLPAGAPFGTVEAKINFLLPVRTGELLAEAGIVHQGRSTAVLEATVYNIDGEERRAIARILGTFSFAQSKT